ncbi:glycosyltransferase family 39 protein [Oceanicola sp. 502str15]|uniref:ArnT family glycosyltransferase n=1 Tax=Oceanicola sp. 502str15 TaxID=2696061 RepID=UPI002094E57F|nr:glycosyltransferase family 39 protein [Oceanicola sp. 502str15]MCO6384086.1 phospholipid carrier-dependent glycosyltransferase [Oceanicola sp. 502str15]
MSASAKPERPWFGTAFAVVAALVIFRLALLPLARAEVFVDEAQYWLWGQELAFGYYSKPPMIGWLLRAVTELAGSDSAFWLRAPAVLLHGVTALLLAGLANELADRRTAILVAASYITLPLVAVGSFLISTDTVMFPFLAGALWAWVRVIREQSRGAALLAGALVGLAVMSKYAGLYYVLCAGLAAVFVPGARVRWSDAGLALGALLVVISPNIIWNIQNGLSTLEHTMDNADWVRDPGARARLNWAALGEFAGSQFVVFGPVLLVGLLWSAVKRRSAMLLWFALPILLLVCGQALLSKAYANWAAAAYLAGTIAAVITVRGWGRWAMGASLALGAGFAVVLVLATVFAPVLRLGDGPLLMERYLGRIAMSATIAARAEAEGVTVVVADDRDVLADLFYRIRGRSVAGKIMGLEAYARPERGRPPNHYVQSHAFAGSPGDVLYVSRSAAPPACEGAVALAPIAPGEGAFRRRPQTVWRVPGDCWKEGARP